MPDKYHHIVDIMFADKSTGTLEQTYNDAGDVIAMEITEHNPNGETHHTYTEFAYER